MSIQDESFPYDDDLEMSRTSGQPMIFPHHKPRLIKVNSRDLEEDDDDDEMGEEGNAEISTVSSPGHNTRNNDSTQSSNDGPPESETSGKTNASETQASEPKKTEFIRNPQSKSVSYQDIHSEYTKRRYKHVESKVGQYIANIKAQDEKRRSGKFQRHRSMPETLSGPKSVESAADGIRNVPQKRGILRHSTNDLDDIRDHESAISDHDTENFDNITGTTTTSTSSSRDIIQDAGIYLDKQTYEQLLSDRERGEYLQSMMDEKKAEIWRLKQNLDTMRIEYTMCKDKLKQLNQTQRMSLGGGGTGGLGGPYGLNSITNVSRNSLQCLLSQQQEFHDKATQTENLLTPSPVPPLMLANRTEMFDTPLTPDSNNNSCDHNAIGVMAPAHLKVPKNIATIQPLSLNFSNLLEQDNSRDCSINNTMGFLRQRSNSMANRQKSTPLAMALNSSKNMGSANKSFIPNSEAGIDIEVIESSPRKQRQSRREEFIYFENRSQRNTSARGGHNLAEAETTCSPAGLTTTMIVNTSSGTDSVLAAGRKSTHNRRSLGTRMMRLFGACTKCDDPNRSMDTTLDQSQHQSYSQIPLLEKSRTNRRPNLR
ncbi:protein swallow [Musca vetustissima]|uniref:protein swallow n=1 Tax=Musca vetustissima TaxID=27455 RepID=UPI002AB624A4|nr:protein swallow [Musca vetustissima]